MIGSLDNPPIVIRAARAKSLAQLGGSLALAGLCLSMAGWGQLPDPMLWSAAALFGLAAILSAWQLFQPSTLTLSPEGVRYMTIWKTHALGWRDIAGFRPARVRSAVLTGFDYSPLYQRNAALRRFNTGALGVNAALAPGGELDPEPLCALLNQARERWGDGA